VAGQSEIDQVRDATDLVQLIGEHIPLQPKGREHIGLCPFHDDHKPSMSVVTHKGNAFYKCFSCGATGDAFTFVMQYHRKDFGEALRFLADRAGVTLRPRARAEDRRGEPSRADVRRANEFAASFFRQTLEDAEPGRAGRDLLEQRGISDAMVDAFMLGVAPDRWDGLVSRMAHKPSALRTAVAAGLIQARKDGSGHFDIFRHRLIFPICDELGVPIAFGGRTLDADENVKYLNSPESPVFSKSKVLYGLHLARRAIIDAGQAIVAEGYTDVIACHQADLTNVVGTLGTALTRGQARLLSRLCDRVVLVFDGDEAGRRAADRAVEVFFHEPVDIRICVLPEGLDPDDLLRRDDGREQFQAALDRATDALTYKFERFREQFEERDTLSGRQKLVQTFMEDLSRLGFASLQGVRKRGVILQLADLLGLPADDLQRMLPRRRPALAPSPETLAPAPTGPVASDLLTTPQDVAGPSRARRLAEHGLLSLLVYDPQLGRRELLEREGRTVCPYDALAPDDFRDPAAHRIAQHLLPWLRDGTEVTVPKLHAAVDDEHCRRVTSQMYFDGQKVCGAAEASPDELLRLAVAALDDHGRRAEYDEAVQAARRDLNDSDPAAVQALQALLERRRRESHLPAAISQGVRTST
jgi:DNA primase